MNPNATPIYPTGTATYGSPAQSQTVSMGDWLVTYIISVIPVVGIIMLFVWAFSSSTPPSKANWAKAGLIVSAIFIVLGGLFASSIMAVLMSAGGRSHY